jgi:hypothetical protein
MQEGNICLMSEEISYLFAKERSCDGMSFGRDYVTLKVKSAIMMSLKHGCQPNRVANTSL